MKSVTIMIEGRTFVITEAGTGVVVLEKGSPACECCISAQHAIMIEAAARAMGHRNIL